MRSLHCKWCINPLSKQILQERNKRNKEIENMIKECHHQIVRERERENKEEDDNEPLI